MSSGKMKPSGAEKMTVNMKARNVRTGIKGESAIKELLELQGYECWYPDTDKSGDLMVYDPLTINLRKIEIKTANKGKDGTWKFCLYREGKTDARHADIVALVFRNGRETVIRFMRVSDIADKKMLKFPSLPYDYSGKYSQSMYSILSHIKSGSNENGD